MELELEFTTHDDILIATVRGVHDRESDETIDREVARHCRERGFNKVIVDERQLRGDPRSVLDSYDAGTALSERGFHRATKIVFLDLEMYRESNEMYRLVSSNRGHLVRHAYTMEDAIELLRDEEQTGTD